MRKTIVFFILILVGTYVTLSIVSNNPEFASEKMLYYAVKNTEKINNNPDVIPPKMLQEAEKGLREVVKKYPATKAALAAQFALAKFCVLTKQNDKAISVLDAIIKKPKVAPIYLSQAYVLKGNIYERNKRWEKALNEYRIVRDRYRDTWLGTQMPLSIADYYKRLNKDAEATDAYNDAIIIYEALSKKAKGTVTGYFASTLLIQCYCNINNYTDAGRVVEDVIKSYPVEVVFIEQLPAIEFIYVQSLHEPLKAVALYTFISQNTKDSAFLKILKTRIATLEAASKK